MKEPTSRSSSTLNPKILRNNTELNENVLSPDGVPVTDQILLAQRGSWRPPRQGPRPGRPRLHGVEEGEALARLRIRQFERQEKEFRNYFNEFLKQLKEQTGTLSTMGPKATNPWQFFAGMLDKTITLHEKYKALQGTSLYDEMVSGTDAEFEARLKETEVEASLELGETKDVTFHFKREQNRWRFMGAYSYPVLIDETDHDTVAVKKTLVGLPSLDPEILNVQIRDLKIKESEQKAEEQIKRVEEENQMTLGEQARAEIKETVLREAFGIETP